jgi:hypothetical protein
VWFLLSCIATTDPLGGSWQFSGDGVIGSTHVQSGCEGERRIGIWGDTWGTRGEVRATVTESDDGVVWMHFPVRTGLGEATGALRIEGNGAVLPLGARPGEWVVSMTRQPGAADRDVVYRAEAQAMAKVDQEQQIWSSGAFLIQEGEQIIGEIQFRGDQSPLVALYSAFWLTQGAVPADLVEDGADLALTFSVEPALASEDGHFRISVPFRELVLPLGPVPSDVEVRFSLVPGRVSEEERDVLVAAAIEQADLNEAERAHYWGTRLAKAATMVDGGCFSFSQMEGDMFANVLVGYDVDIVVTEAGCAVDLEPLVKQHGRRFRGRINSEGR